MNRCWGILLLLAVAALPARAHFIRILPGQVVERQSTARGIFAVAQAGHTGSTSRRHADPAATRLLAEARAARAQWADFPGFAADLEVNREGKITHGTVKVNARGRLHLDLSDPAARAWAKDQLGATVAHRLDDSASLETPCAFVDEDLHYPLGRAVRVLNDDFHSSYRIRDRQITVVNRRLKNARFTITVMENLVNAEKKFLPVSYVVNTWDREGKLLGSDTYRQTWKRVGAFDLPLTVTVVTAAKGKQEARRLTLSNFKLMP